MSLSDIFDIPSMGVLYNQALADVRSTGAGIKCLYCSSGHFHSYFATDFDENSMASTMNSGGSIDLNRNGQ